jgi:hypothetical protein
LKIAIRILRLLCATALAVAGGAGVHAQSYPVRPLRLIVPQPPGGGNDTIARMIGQRLAGTLKQQIVIDNRAGAGGLIGAELAAKAAPDGYTLLLGNVATLAVITQPAKTAAVRSAARLRADQPDCLRAFARRRAPVSARDIHTRTHRAGESAPGAVELRVERHRQHHPPRNRDVQVDDRDESRARSV